MIQNVRYIFWDTPLNVKLVAERPPCRFCGEGLQDTWAYIFKAPLKNTLKNVAYILGTSSHLKTVVIIYGGFLKWGYPNSWMVYFMEHPPSL